MKRTGFPVIFCVFMLCLVLLSDTASSVLPPVTAFAAEDHSSSQTSGQSAAEKANAAFDAAEPILEKLKQTVADELAGSKADETADSKADENSGSNSGEKDAEFDVGRAEAKREELDGYKNQLDGLLSDISGLPDDLNTNEGKTVCAVREYLTMLRDMSADMYELVGYSVDLYAALQAIGNLNSDTEDFAVLTDQIVKGTGAALEIMDKIEAPAYLDISHGDLNKRIQEFKDFGVDFQAAVEINDPLRIYSCLFRMNRIMTAFTKCGDNLNEDIRMQFNQADRRLKGPIATLHDELSQNLGLLQAA